MTPVVADSGPLISFARAHQLGLLRAVLPELLIPEAVYEEIVVAGAGQPGAAEVSTGDWIQVRALLAPSFLNQVPTVLHIGERQAIALALGLQAHLLIDERAGRREAQRLGVPLLSSLAVLRTAKERNHIPTVRPVLDALRATGFRLHVRYYVQFLHDVGETV